jgi:hypothetical protein
MKNVKKVVKHLKGDIKTFRKEAAEDKELIKKLKEPKMKKKESKAHEMKEMKMEKKVAKKKKAKKK